MRTFDVDASITRGSNTYGPNQYPEKFIPLFVTNALDGEALPLYGDGRQVRDWLFVEDHCAGIEFVLREGKPGEIYNVGGGDEHENIEVAERILELTGADRSLLRSVADREGHDRRYSLDTTKLRTLGWQPQTLVRGRPARDGAVVSRPARLVAADQVGRVPRVLRAAVRRAARKRDGRLVAVPVPVAVPVRRSAARPSARRALRAGRARSAAQPRGTASPRCTARARSA